MVWRMKVSQPSLSVVVKPPFIGRFGWRMGTEGSEVRSERADLESDKLGSNPDSINYWLDRSRT